MIPSHHFSQIPTAYYRELQIKNPAKAVAFAQYSIDNFANDMLSVRGYASVWNQPKSTAARWIEDFSIAIQEFHQSCSRNAQKNANKTKHQKPKKSGTTMGRKQDKNGTLDGHEKPQNQEFKEMERDMNGTEYGQLQDSDTLIIKKDINIGGNGCVNDQLEDYIQFRLSEDGINSPTAFEKSLRKELLDTLSDEYSRFKEWQILRTTSPAILIELIDLFANFAHGSRKKAREIAKEDYPDVAYILFELAFQEACRLRGVV
jgi:hypothetical protein